MVESINFNDPDEATASYADLTFQTKNAYDEDHEIIPFNFEGGKRYGPFFRIDGPEWKHSPDIKEGRWAGLSEPGTRQEAEDWYRITADITNNPKTHVHKFFISIPPGIKKAVGFLGKVKRGTSFQIKLNNIAVEWIERIGNPKELLSN